jgi:hypothetical protein
MGWNFYNASGELQINDGGVQASAAVFTGNVDLGSNLLVGNAGSTGIAISANGEVNMAVQPSFLSYANATLSNVSGDGTAYTLVTNVDLWDLGGDHDGTSTFTAPVTGKYMMVGRITSDAVASGHAYGVLTLDASNRDFETVFHAYNMTNGSGSHTLQVSAVVDMDASDTIVFKVTYSGGSKVIDILGHSTNPKSSFSGWLMG